MQLGGQMSEAESRLGVGLIGCGLIGQKRARALPMGDKLLTCADVSLDRAEALAKASGAKAVTDWRAVTENPAIDVVMVATPHHMLAEITLAAVNAGKHVLVEKPAARFASELEPVLAARDNKHVQVHVGFNHRYHRALRKAKELASSGALGELMFIRGRYGHGGRIGYENEWRANPAISGGGELIDQGPHLIDLSRWFLGEFTEVAGWAETYFWKMPVDDNGFMLLKTQYNQTAFLHVSCTEWKNLFSLEIYGRDGKLDLSGLGGSYGVERVTWYKMLPEMGPPETYSWEYPMGDDSWNVETVAFLDDLKTGRPDYCGLEDAIAALRIVETIYKRSGYDHCA
jgi:predicted dehydrogenase